MRATAQEDYRVWELGLVTAVAITAQLAVLVLLNVRVKRVVSDVPEIDKGIETPVKVKPVLDLEGVPLKLGGKKPVLPDMWQAPVPRAPAPPKASDKSFASTKTDDTEAPEKKKPMASAGTEPPPPDAGEKEPLDASTEPPDAGTAEPSDTPPGQKDEGTDAGVPDGKTTDAAEKNQKATYAARIGAFLASIGRSHCGGAHGTVGGTVTLSGQTVASISMNPSGNADIDSNVIPAMQGAVGQQIPPPPDEHPDWVPSSFAVTINCK